jgi:hypothetical protein
MRRIAGCCESLVPFQDVEEDGSPTNPLFLGQELTISGWLVMGGTNRNHLDGNPPQPAPINGIQPLPAEGCIRSK